MFEDAAVSRLTDSSIPGRSPLNLRGGRVRPNSWTQSGGGGLYVNQPKSSKREEAVVTAASAPLGPLGPLGPPRPPSARR